MVSAESAGAGTCSSPVIPAFEAKSGETHSYFAVSVLDFKVDQVLVRFIADLQEWKEDEWVPNQDVRFAPKVTQCDYRPDLNDIVDVRTRSAVDEPYSWWRAQVKSIKGDFYLVTFIDWDACYDDIMELEQIRPANPSPPVDLSDVARKVIAVPKSLQASAKNWSFASIQSTTGTLAVWYNDKVKAVIALGSSTALEKVNLLIETFFEHQMRLKIVLDRTNAVAEKLEETKRRALDCVVREFSVDPKLMGLVIGVKGKYVKEVQAIEEGIRVRVEKGSNIIRIFAKTEEAALAAQKRLELVEERISIPKSSIGWILGPKGKFIKGFEAKSGVRRLQLVDVNNNASLLLLGTKDDVEKCALLIQQHLSFGDEYRSFATHERQMSTELAKIQRDIGFPPLPRSQLHDLEGTYDTHVLDEANFSPEERGQSDGTAIKKYKKKNKNKKIKGQVSPLAVDATEAAASTKVDRPRYKQESQARERADKVSEDEGKLRSHEDSGNEAPTEESRGLPRRKDNRLVRRYRRKQPAVKEASQEESRADN